MVDLGGAPLRLSSRRVVVESARLESLARVLCEEVLLATGATWDVARGVAGPGDVGLRFAAEIGGGYRLRADDRVVIESADVIGVAMGTVTLLQALRACDSFESHMPGGAAERRQRHQREPVSWSSEHALSEESVPSVPRLEIEDAPRYAFRGVMVDCARHLQSIETLRRVICLCRFYKIGLLQLHLTDDQAFAFPSQRYPELATAGRCYTRAELEELERFATARGVVLVPELDGPGHGAAMIRALPELFGVGRHEQHASLIHIGREAVYRVLDELVGEMCSVFRSSPFFHIGGDEVSLAPLEADAEARAYGEKHALSGVDDLFRHYLVRMHAAVARHGKRAVAWEGFRPGGAVDIPRDLVVVAWDTSWQQPGELLAAGHQIVNASWQPLYIVGPHGPHGTSRMWSQGEVFRWSPTRWEHFESDRPSFGGLDVASSADLLGGLMCSWEQRDSATLPGLRDRVAPFAERSWNGDGAGSFADWVSRHRVADQRLARILGG